MLHCGTRSRQTMLSRECGAYESEYATRFFCEPVVVARPVSFATPGECILYCVEAICVQQCKRGCTPKYVRMHKNRGLNQEPPFLIAQARTRCYLS